MSLYAKRLERGRFIWPVGSAGTMSISSAQLGYMLDGIDWRQSAAQLAAVERPAEPA